MKRLFHLFFVVIILTNLLFIQSCKKDENPVVPPEPETILAENTIQVSVADFTNSLISIDSIKVVLTTSSNIANDLKIGGFLVSEYGDGILRKILNKQTINNQIILTTQQARLDEVIKKGKIYYKGFVDPQSFRLEAASDSSIRILKTSSQLYVTFQGVKFGGNANMEINSGTVFQNPEFVLDIEFNNGISKFECYLNVTNESYIEVNSTGNVVVGGSFIPPWARFVLPPIPSPIGIPVVPKIQFGIGGDINIPNQSHSRFDAVINTKMGFGMNNFIPYPISTVTPTTQVTSDLVVEGAYLRNYLIFPKVGLYVVGLLGPYFEQQVSINGVVAADNVGKYLSFGFGVTGKGGVEFDLFGLLQAGANFNIYDKNWDILKNYLNQNLPPDPPTLLSPSNGATNTPVIPTLSWNASTNATSYTLQVSTNSNFTSYVYNQSGLNSTNQQISGLNILTQYYWRVRATNNYGTSDFSTVWNFTTAAGSTAPEPPTLSSPSDGATSVSITPTLSWSSSSDASSYRLQVSTNSNFTSYIYNQGGLTNTSQQISGLNNLTQYYWRVRASNSYGNSDFSTVWSFTTVQSGGGGIPTEGLVAYYPFNGNANDESGNGHTGTLHNLTLTTDRFGNVGKAYYFLGNSTSYIQTDTSSQISFSGYITLVVWVKGTGSLNDILRVNGTTNDGAEIGTYSDGTAISNFSYGNANWQNIISNSTINNNNWHMVTAVISENRGNLFVDGVSVKDTTFSGSFLMTKPGFIVIGRHPIATSRAFNGTIDDIRIYNRALLYSEIQQLYHEGGW